MPTVNLQSIRSSFRYALKGLRYVFQHEQSFRIQLVATIVVLGLVVALDVSRRDTVLLFLVIGLVLTLEILNSAVEVIVDLLKPRMHPYAQVIKDLMAAAVLLASFVALLIGVFVFVPYFAPFLRF